MSVASFGDLIMYQKKGYWKKKKDNQQKYLDWLANQLGIKKTEEWCNIAFHDFINTQRGGTYLLLQYIIYI
jgi:hypothetical protein